MESGHEVIRREKKLGTLSFSTANWDSFYNAEGTNSAHYRHGWRTGF